jgi:SH3 domain.
MYNYQAREDTDVSFTKGDRMEVLDDRLNVVLFFHRYITVASF